MLVLLLKFGFVGCWSLGGSFHDKKKWELQSRKRLWLESCVFLGYFHESCLSVQIDENVQREIINHQSLRHPNIVRFKEVIRKSWTQ